MTLDDLKRAIDRAQPTKHRLHINGKEAQKLRAEAWRTAFLWRDSVEVPNRHCTCKQCKIGVAEFDEGMAQIREKLQ